MWFQQAVALYYVSVDCILVSQYYYFSVIDNSATVLEGQSVRYDESIDDDNSGDSYLVDSETETEAERRRREKKSKPTWHVGGRSRSLASTLIVVVSVMGHLAGATPVGINTITDSSPLTPPNISTLQALGSVLSWFSTLLYLISRLPQLLLNYRRRSTSGLAISLFVAAFFGNLFYSLSLLLNPLGHQDYPPYGGGGLAGKDGSDHQEWWSRTLPFFVGASGVLSLDFAVSWQWLAWGERTPGGSGSDALFCSGEEEEDSAEICGMQTNWRQWWPWNGWFADTAAEMKALIGEEDRGYGTTATGSGTGR